MKHWVIKYNWINSHHIDRDATYIAPAKDPDGALFQLEEFLRRQEHVVDWIVQSVRIRKK